MISISNLNLSYGSRQVVSDFSASFEQATITAILGANGTGKSTLLTFFIENTQKRVAEIGRAHV